RGSDLSKVGVDPLNQSQSISRRNGERPVSTVELCRLAGDLTIVVDGVSDLHADGSDVAYRKSHRVRKLALDVQVPLDLVAARWIRFNARGLQRIHAQSGPTIVRE